MSENENRLTPEREKMLRSYFKGAGPIDLKGQELLAEIDALNAEVKRLREALAARRTKMDAATRDAALEEVLSAMEARCPGQWQTTWHEPKALVRALKSRPAERYLRESEVRDALLAYYSGTSECRRRDLLDGVAMCLGMDLDAEGEPTVTEHDGNDVVRMAKVARDTRQTCTCTGSCRGPEGLGAGWKCALGKETAPALDAKAEPVVAPPPTSEGLCDRCGEPAIEHDAAGRSLGIACDSFVPPRADS